VLIRAALASLAIALALPAAALGDPPLDVPAATLQRALLCPEHFAHSARDPVLLVHGTGLNESESWSWNYEKALGPAGYDWCAVTLPDRAMGDIQVSAEYVVYAIERIHALTGRRLVVITHSQGGMEGRWAMRWWSGARPRTDDLIDLASPNHGIYGADLCAESGNCWPAVWQMASGSHFLRALNSVSETPGPVAYTQVFSTTDELVEPSATARLTGRRNATNIAIQSICPGRVVHHAGLLSDAVVWSLVLEAMSHPGPANPGRISRTVCLRTTMPHVAARDFAFGNAFLYGRAAIAFEQHRGVREEPPLEPYARRYG
jgi:triacylglycerol lipase